MSASHRMRSANVSATSAELNAGLIGIAREQLAQRLGVDVAKVRPCVAMIPPQPEGLRGQFARVLAVEYLRAGAAEGVVTALLGEWASQCAQPPRAAVHPFTAREVASTVKSAARRKETLRGYGCDTGPLAEACPYPAGKAECPYILGRRRPRRRESFKGLVSAFNLCRGHRAPATWRAAQTIRRKFLLLAFAALETAKGYSGGELITSHREIAFQAGIPLSTVRRDLWAMKSAGWIEYTPGRSRAEIGDLPRGARIRRLLPGDAAAALVQSFFPGASVEGQR